MTHHYRIAASNPAAHLFQVRLTVDSPDPGGQRFSLPAWIPGSYRIRDYAKHVVAIRAESDGVEVGLGKLDKRTWQAEAVMRPLTLVAEIYAYDPSVRGAHLDLTHAYFNGPCLFPAVVGQEDDACELEVVCPDAPGADRWRVATAMRRKSAERYGFGTYVADDYDELIDHPFEIGELAIGEFDAGGIPHAIAIRGRTRVDMGRLCHDLETLCTRQLAFLGAPDDLDRYLFLVHAPEKGYGGLEHRWSSSIEASRQYLPTKRTTAVDTDYRTFLGVASHEYFHLWNVKRIRPAAVATSDLGAETYTTLLWVFEGITSYYDDLLLFRSGLIGQDDYLELIGRKITRVYRGAGRNRQSVADSSFDAWTKFYQPDANANNAIVSYYAKGALIALCLDLRLRTETDGRVSLDDVMLESWRRYGETGEPMPEVGFESLCAELSGLDLADFFDAAVRGTGDLPLEPLLESHGIRMRWRTRAGADDKGGERADDKKLARVRLGGTLSTTDGKSEFASIDSDGPAERAGVAPGDVAIAIDGLKLTADNIDARLKSCVEGEVVPLTLFRGDELLTLDVRLDAARETTCYLVADDSPSADAESRREAWLAGRGDAPD